jgi:hypothetical protein
MVRFSVLAAAAASNNIFLLLLSSRSPLHDASLIAKQTNFWKILETTHRMN